MYCVCRENLGKRCVEISAKNKLGVQDDVSLLLEKFLRKRNEQKGSLKLHLSFQILTHCLIINVVFVIFFMLILLKRRYEAASCLLLVFRFVSEMEGKKNLKIPQW